MSALYVTCPNCGPLCSFIPQGGQFEMNMQCCTCGVKIYHKENGTNYSAAIELREKLARYHGKIPVQERESFTKNEQSCSLNKPKMVQEECDD